MATVTKITASAGRTINIGNYHSLRFDASVEVELEDGDDRAAVIRGAFQLANDEVERQATRRLDTIKEDRDSIFAHVIAEGRR